MRISFRKYPTGELHILKTLCELLTRNRVYDITDSEQVEPRITYVLPREMNKTWFVKVVLHKKILIDPSS